MRKATIALITALTLLNSSGIAADGKKKPITLINAFMVPDGKEAEAIAYWEKAAEFMRTQPGYVSTALHEAVLPDAKFHLINVAKWETAEAFLKASKAFRTSGGIKPVKGVVPNPSLYTVIRSD